LAWPWDFACNCKTMDLELSHRLLGTAEQIRVLFITCKKYRCLF
jgi:hypothetical protein